MAKVFLALKVYTSFSFRFPVSFHRTIQANEHFKSSHILIHQIRQSIHPSIHYTLRFIEHFRPSHILMVLSEEECKFFGEYLGRVLQHASFSFHFNALLFIPLLSTKRRCCKNEFCNTSLELLLVLALANQSSYGVDARGDG